MRIALFAPCPPGVANRRQFKWEVPISIPCQPGGCRYLVADASSRRRGDSLALVGTPDKKWYGGQASALDARGAPSPSLLPGFSWWSGHAMLGAG